MIKKNEMVLLTAVVVIRLVVQRIFHNFIKKLSHR